jgi:hypothetical protein
MRTPISEQQSRAAKQAADHARRQAVASEEAVKEARRANGVSRLAMAVTAVIATLAVIATVAAPFLAQWNSDASSKKTQREAVSAEIDDLENIITLVGQESRLTEAPITRETLDSDLQGELVKGSAELEYLHPVAIARADIAKAIVEYNKNIAYINSRSPKDILVYEGMGPYGAPVSTPIVAVGRRRSVALWVLRQNLSGALGRQATSINAEALKWNLFGKRCLSEDGYPMKMVSHTIKIACKQPTAKKPIAKGEEKNYTLIFHSVQLSDGQEVVAEVLQNREATLSTD